MRIRLLAAVLCGISLQASEPVAPSFWVDGQYRGRIDAYDGVNKAAYGDLSVDSKGNVKGKSDDVIYLQQIIAGINYIPSSEWEYKLYFYDSRSWGSSLSDRDFLVNSGTPDEYAMNYYDDHAELYTSYIRRNRFLVDNLSLTVGRQKLGYGDRRIFGPGEWGNTMGWLWDGVHFSYRDGKNFLDGWYGQTRIKAPDDFSILEKHRYQGIGIYGHYEIGSMAIEPFGAWKNPLYHEQLPYQDFYYGGMRWFNRGYGWIFDMTSVKEFGHSAEKQVDAYAYVVKAGYAWENVYQPKMMFGYTYATGDSNPNDNEVETFSTPFGMNDGSFYGRADMVIWSNIKDYEFHADVQMMPALNLTLGLHRFELADPKDKWYEFGYRNKNGNMYTHIGDEVDLTAAYKVNRNIDLLGIVSYFSPGDFIIMNQIGSDHATKLFFQATYRFSTR